MGLKAALFKRGLWKGRPAAPLSALCRPRAPRRYSYERSAIEEWFKKNSTSPMTNEELENKELVPNRALRAVIKVLYAPVPQE